MQEFPSVKDAERAENILNFTEIKGIRKSSFSVDVNSDAGWIIISWTCFWLQLSDLTINAYLGQSMKKQLWVSKKCEDLSDSQCAYEVI